MRDERIIAKNGEYYLRAQDVRVGDLLDFEGDSIVDPENKGERYDPEPPATYTSFQYEFAQVLSVERETPTCVRIDTDQGSYGFPIDYEIETTLDNKDGTLATPADLEDADPPCAYCGEPTVMGDCDDPTCEANAAR